MDAGYVWKNETPHFTIFNKTRSVQNLFTGAVCVFVPLCLDRPRLSGARLILLLSHSAVQLPGEREHHLVD